MSVPDFTLGFASRFLAEKYHGDATRPTPLAGGEWSSAYAYTCAGSEWVIRFSRFGEDFAKDELAGRYGSPDLPIPVVVERGDVRGGSYAVTPRVRGAFLDDLDNPAFELALPSLFAAIRAMRLADTSASCGFGPWDCTGQGAYRTWQSYLLDVGADDRTRRTHGWRAKLASDPRGEAVFRAGMAALTEVVPACPDDRSLIHADLLNRNIFIDHGHVVGVIDWGGSLYGDSLYDAALLAFWSPWFPAIDEDAVIEAARGLPGARTNFHERMRAYQLHIGLDHIAYNAHLGGERRDEMKRVCSRTAHVARST